MLARKERVLVPLAKSVLFKLRDTFQHVGWGGIFACSFKYGTERSLPSSEGAQREIMTQRQSSESYFPELWHCTSGEECASSPLPDEARSLSCQSARCWHRREQNHCVHFWPNSPQLLSLLLKTNVSSRFAHLCSALSVAFRRMAWWRQKARMPSNFHTELWDRQIHLVC